MALRVAVVTYGVKHAFPGELAIARPGSVAQPFKPNGLADNFGGNTNCGTVAWDDESGSVLFRMVVDAGMGVLRGLAEDPHGPKRVDLILITHGHIDHHSELVCLCGVPARMAGRDLGGLGGDGPTSGQPTPIPIYAHPKVAKRLGEIHGHTLACPEAGQDPAKATHGWLHYAEPMQATDGASRRPPVMEGPHPGHVFTIVPVGNTGHGDGYFYVVEFGQEGDRKRIVFAWDLGHVPWAGLSASEGEAVVRLLAEADLMLVDMNTRFPRDTGHGCFSDVRELVIRTRPRCCQVVHYSGFEDLHPHPDQDPDKPPADILCLDQLDEWLAEQSASDDDLRNLPPITAAGPGNTHEPAIRPEGVSSLDARQEEDGRRRA